MDSIFPYPGGKTYLASWIIDYVPDHHGYVEPFAGSASVFMNKPPSPVEVLNDRDGDITHFYDVFREQTDELVEWLRDVPFSRDKHLEWANEYYDGYRPEDDVERAGRFFFLRYSQYSAKYTGISGFTASSRRCRADRFRNAIEDLQAFKERFDSVTIDNRDYSAIVDSYDNPDTFFYLDPPYVEEGDALYTGDDFNHARLIDCITGTEGRWMLSYRDLPEGLSDYWVIEKNVSQVSNRDRENRQERATERLVMNYDPETEESMHFDTSNRSKNVFKALGVDT